MDIDNLEQMQAMVLLCPHLENVSFTECLNNIKRRLERRNSLISPTFISTKLNQVLQHKYLMVLITIGGVIFKIFYLGKRSNFPLMSVWK